MKILTAFIFLFIAMQAHAEDLTVKGTIHPVIVSNFQRMENNYETIAATAPDGMSLHLHVFAVLKPSDKTPSLNKLYLDTTSGNISLLKAGSNEIILPAHPDFGKTNPNVMASLRSDESVHFTATVSFDHQPLSQFSDQEARSWMAALDRRLSHKVGYILDMLVPDTKTIMVSVPPHAEFDVMINDQKNILVLNQGDIPYIYNIIPKDYPKNALFVSTAPLKDIDMKFPVEFNTWHGH